MTYSKCRTIAPRPPMGDDFGDMLDALFAPAAVDITAADPSDNVTQHATGVTTSAADFTQVSGVCKAANFPALAAVKEFQAQLNRCAQALKLSKIAVDGAVGPGTMALFAKVQATSSGQVMGTAGACMGVAPDVDVIGEQLKAYADTLGAPANVDPPLLSQFKAPTIVTKSGKTIVAPDAPPIGASLAQLSGVEKVALLAVAGGIGYMLLSGGKKKPKSKGR